MTSMRNYRGATHSIRIARPTTYGIGVVGAVTAVAYMLHANFPIVGCFYLLVVVVQSVSGSSISSGVVSVIAVLCLDYFFVPPTFSLKINRPLDALALLTFLVTALVITLLASRAGEEAQKAEARRKDLARLYDLASRLVSVGADIAVARGYLNTARGTEHNIRPVLPWQRELADFWHRSGAVRCQKNRSSARGGAGVGHGASQWEHDCLLTTSGFKRWGDR